MVFEFASLDGAGVTTNANINGLLTKATGIYTLSANVDNADTVTIGAQTYTWETSLTNSPDFVKIGAAATNSLDNLIAAVTNGAGEGTTYGTGTVENANTIISAGAGDTADGIAKSFGTAGNSIATTDTGGGNGTWGAVTLEGGVDNRQFEVVNGGASMEIYGLTVFVRDTAIGDSNYGAISALSNGVDIKVMSGASTVVKDILGGLSLKINRDFYKIFPKVEKGSDWLQAFIPFDDPLVLKVAERLEITIQDNLTGLLEHYFFVTGHTNR